MKRWISLLMAMTLLLGFCACSDTESDASDDESPAANSASSDAASEESVSSTAEQNINSGEKTKDACVTLEETQTKYGLIQIPQIDEAMLDSEDIRLANDLFRSIRDSMLERVEECKKEWGDETYHDAAEPICSSRYTQNDSSLSITVKYTTLYPASTSMESCEAVNIDISTGKALDYHEVIKAAGFTEDEVRAALRCYADRCLFNEWEHDVFYNCAEEGTIPDGLGDPSYGWQEALDELTASYDAPVPHQGEPWDVLPRYPVVYAGEAGLEVCAKIPIAAGEGNYDTMVCIGHNDTETRRLNPNNPFGIPFGRSAMLIDAAHEAVAQSIELVDAYTDGVEYKLSAESMENIESDEQVEPAYVFKVYTDEGAHVATVGWYAVGAFSGMLWEMDSNSGEWTTIMNGTGLLPEGIFTGANSNGVLAVIWNEPGEYGCWAADSCAEIDLTAYGSDSNDYIDSETLMLFARHDDTVVSFESGTMEGDGFAPQTQLWSVTLDDGESLKVFLDRPETPTQAIIVSTADDAGTYIIRYYDPDDMPQIEYITSDSAMG